MRSCFTVWEEEKGEKLMDWGIIKRRWEAFGLVAILMSTSVSAAKKDACESALGEDDQIQQRVLEAVAGLVIEYHHIPSVKDVRNEAGVRTADVKVVRESLGLKSVAELWTYVRNQDESLREKLGKRMLIHAVKHLKSEMTPPTEEDLAADLAMSAPEQFTLIFGSIDRLWELLWEYRPKDVEILRNKLMRGYSTAASKVGRTPRLQEAAEELKADPAGVESLIGEGRLFESLALLKALATEKHERKFLRVVDTDIFATPERQQALMHAVETKSRFVVTTAVAGAPVDEEFLQSLSNYADQMDAAILVFPANMQTTGLSETLLNHPNVHILTESIRLIPQLTLNRIKVTAKQIDSLTGLERIGSRIESQIIGSPKLFVKTISSVDNEDYPHVLTSTGAVTKPHYDGNKYIQGRTDRIAEVDHTMGALIVEKSSGGGSALKKELNPAGLFHMRHVEYIPERRGFTDLDRFYGADLVEESRPDAMVLGDIHVGDTDQKLLEAIKAEILKFRPRTLVLHDLMNGHSISHHEADQAMTLAGRASSGKLNLEKEIRQVMAFVNALLEMDPDMDIAIVSSNHNDWLAQYLQAGRYLSEPHNHDIGLAIARAVRAGRDPVEYVLTELGLDYRTQLDRERNAFPLVDSRRISVFQTKQNFKVGPMPVDGPRGFRGRQVELGIHGHKGAKGARGSVLSFQKGVDRMVYGHTHGYERRNGIVNIGTSTTKVLGYTHGGLSDWQQVLALVSSDGAIQAIGFADDEFYSEETKAKKKAFIFPKGFPMVETHAHAKNQLGQVDSYTNANQQTAEFERLVGSLPK